MQEERNAGPQKSLALLPHSEIPHQALLAELLKVTNGVSPTGTGTLLYGLCKSEEGVGELLTVLGPFKAFVNDHGNLDCLLLFFSFSLCN